MTVQCAVQLSKQCTLTTTKHSMWQYSRAMLQYNISNTCMYRGMYRRTSSFDCIIPTLVYRHLASYTNNRTFDWVSVLQLNVLQLKLFPEYLLLLLLCS